MPCRHHHHCSGCCCSCASSCCTSCAAASPQSPSAADHLLQLLASQRYLHPDPPPPPPSSRRHSKHSPTPPNLNNLYHHHQNQTHQQQEQIPLLQSLLQRISSLESQLSHQHSPSPPRMAAAPTPPAKSLRDLAAWTIQIHFRRYLVRRSQNLRNLHRLAAVKSRTAALRSSLSDRRLNPSIAAASDLFLDLHSIQSLDPVIQEGKRSIQKELARIQDFIHKFSAKDAADDTRCDHRPPAGKKRVSFPLTTLYSDVDDQIHMNDHNHNRIGDCDGALNDGDCDGEVREVKEIIEEEDEDEEEESYSGKSGNSGRLEGQKGNWNSLSPPVPVHMEAMRS